MTSQESKISKKNYTLKNMLLINIKKINKNLCFKASAIQTMATL